MQEINEAGTDDLSLAPTLCLCQNITFLPIMKGDIQPQNFTFIRPYQQLSEYLLHQHGNYLAPCFSQYIIRKRKIQERCSIPTLLLKCWH